MFEVSVAMLLPLFRDTEIKVFIAVSQLGLLVTSVPCNVPCVGNLGYD
jgi:hypothetical protein